MKQTQQDSEGGSLNRQNERYQRKHLRPIAKSVYQNRKVHRLNGSLNGAIGYSGLHMSDSAKGLHSNQMQIKMTQTFNMSILNNSFQMGPKIGTVRDEGGSNTQMVSPRAIRNLATEAFAPFTVIPNAKIPDLSENRREERDERVQMLLKRPKHKETLRGEANISQSDKLMSAPLTMEDTTQFINLPLINTLRDNSKKADPHASMKDGKANVDDDDKEKEGSTSKPLETVPNPPSFYYNDMEKWQKKFQKHIKERDQFKRTFQKTHEMSCLTKNTNITEGDGGAAKGKKGSSSVEPNDPNKSLFNQVLKRRKSRQSTFAPGCIDFDYAGDSAKFQHLISVRNDFGQPNQSQLNFEMKLRGYKNVTEYNTSKAWCFPAVKQFSPKKQWSVRKSDQGLINPEFKRKFRDINEEKNANELLHQFDKRGVNSSHMWQCSLRDLKKMPKNAEKSPKKKQDK